MKHKLLRVLAAIVFTACASGCAGLAESVNPFGTEGGGELGSRDTSALGGGGSGKQAEQARHALEVVGTYQRALPPQPYYPVVRPAEVRLMWIPDHLNRLGDLVPAHYYYLRVTRDVFEVQDAFETERELTSRSGPYAGTGPAGGGGGAPVTAPSGDLGAGGGGGSATPWQYKSGK